MTIGAVSSRSGFAASTIRFYEQQGLLSPPLRVSGKRDYDEEVFTRLDVIRMALQSGFSVQEARTLINGFTSTTRPAERWRQLAAAKLIEIRQRIAQLQSAEKLLEKTAACECTSLKECAAILMRQ